MATINRAKLADLIIKECCFGDEQSQRKAGGKLSTQELLSVYLVLKGVIEFGTKEKAIKFRNTFEVAERLATGRIEGHLPCERRISLLVLCLLLNELLK
jgi:hypothetical protein